LAEERKSQIAKRKVVCVKHSIDMRYTSGSEIVTHNKNTSTAPSYSCLELKAIESELEKYDVILIDEGQFFPDLTAVVDRLAQEGKYIVIAALSSDFRREAFASISAILPKVDQLIQLQAVCTKCGNDAPFTCRLSQEREQTLIGGEESYEPRCRLCFNV
jgi:thymidine kinase